MEPRLDEEYRTYYMWVSGNDDYDYKMLRSLRQLVPGLGMTDMAPEIRQRKRAESPGRTAGECFDPSAQQAIHLYTGGICRNVNKLCMVALMEGFVRRKQILDAEHIEHCVEQF
jgi:hypothetical protein